MKETRKQEETKNREQMERGWTKGGNAKKHFLFSVENGNKLSPFRGQNLCLCSLLCKSLLWNLIFFDFKNRTNFYTSLQQKKFFCHLLKETRVSLKKHFFLLLVHVFFFSHLSLIVVCSVVAATRTSAAGHPLASSRLISCFFFFSCFHCLLFFFTIVFFFVFSFLLDSLFPFVILLFSSLGFVSSVFF